VAGLERRHVVGEGHALRAAPLAGRGEVQAKEWIHR
jgi:hypothetical protein